VIVKTTSKTTSNGPVGRKPRLKAITRSMTNRANSRIRKIHSRVTMVVPMGLMAPPARLREPPAQDWL
jgi:hypothetical protein